MQTQWKQSKGVSNRTSNSGFRSQFRTCLARLFLDFTPSRFFRPRRPLRHFQKLIEPSPSTSCVLSFIFISIAMKNPLQRQRNRSLSSPSSPPLPLLPNDLDRLIRKIIFPAGPPPHSSTQGLTVGRRRL